MLQFSTRSQNRRSRQRDTLTAQPQVPVLVEKLSIFLLSPHSPSTSTASTTSQPRPATPEPPKSRTQTIISISQHSTPHPKLSGVFGRIDRADSVVRTREDASLVLHGLLDVVGDEALAIVERFRSTLEDLEGKVLASAVRSLLTHSPCLADHSPAVEHENGSTSTFPLRSTASAQVDRLTTPRPDPVNPLF